MSERVDNMKADAPQMVVSCQSGNRIYSCKSKAKHFASLVSKATGKAHRPYRCRLCRAWHLTPMSADEVAAMKDFAQRQREGSRTR